MTPSQFQKALNSSLPKDIVIKEAEEVDIDFHAQLDAKSKVYVYRILNSSFPSALERQRAWFVPAKLDVYQMKKAAQLLMGQHDFSAFALSKTNVKTKVRTVLTVSLDEKYYSFIEFHIEANGFLKGMVRLIVGTLVHVGKGKIGVEDFKRILKTGKKTHFVRSAPPQGLFLEEVKY
jgi:tRNA pseudouridine38-40 synthase